MAKKSVPKQKTSKARTSERHAAWRTRARKSLLERFTVVECPQCKAPKLNHTACPECGYYRGRKVVTKPEKQVTTKIKA